jgi:hypothetical protein
MLRAGTGVNPCDLPPSEKKLEQESIWAEHYARTPEAPAFGCKVVSDVVPIVMLLHRSSEEKGEEKTRSPATLTRESFGGIDRGLAIAWRKTSFLHDSKPEPHHSFFPSTDSATEGHQTDWLLPDPCLLLIQT